MYDTFHDRTGRLLGCHWRPRTLSYYWLLYEMFRNRVVRSGFVNLWSWLHRGAPPNGAPISVPSGTIRHALPTELLPDRRYREKA